MLVTFTILVQPAGPTYWVPNVTLVALSCALVADPIPKIGIVSWPPSWATNRLELVNPSAAGTKAMVIWQVEPIARLAGQLFVSEEGAVTEIAEMLEAENPTLETVTVATGLRVPNC